MKVNCGVKGKISITVSCDGDVTKTLEQDNLVTDAFLSYLSNQADDGSDVSDLYYEDLVVGDGQIADPDGSIATLANQVDYVEGTIDQPTAEGTGFAYYYYVTVKFTIAGKGSPWTISEMGLSGDPGLCTYATIPPLSIASNEDVNISYELTFEVPPTISVPSFEVVDNGGSPVATTSFTGTKIDEEVLFVPVGGYAWEKRGVSDVLDSDDFPVTADENSIVQGVGDFNGLIKSFRIPTKGFSYNVVLDPPVEFTSTQLKTLLLKWTFFDAGGK